MDPLFSRMTKRYTPEMNRAVMDGLATTAMQYTEEYLDAQIKSVCKGLPACVKYVGYERCSTQEEYEEVTKIRNNRRTYDLARSTAYLVKYFMQFTDNLGKEHIITRHIWLPYVTEAGIMEISGVKYHIVPVISDKVFTPRKNSVFVRLLQDRINMFRTYHNAVIDGRREARYVIWADIYRNESSSTRVVNTTKAKTTLVHYLFAEYGFTDAFMRYAGIVPVVGGKEITTEAYPKEDWIICESTKVKPSTCIDRVYTPTSIRLAVKRSEWTPQVESLIMGFYYVIDHFPTRFQPRMSYLDDTSLWMILIGHIRFSGEHGEHKLLGSIQEHFDSLIGYLDTTVQEKLAERGIFLENYYDLLNYVQLNFNDMLSGNEREALCVYGKNLEVLYYVLYELISGFVKTKFRLNKIVNKPGRVLSLKDVTENLFRQVRMGAIFKLTSGTIVAEPVSYSGDHKYPKLTAIAAEQESRNGAARGESECVLPSPQNWLDLSMVVVGSVLNLPKSNPTPVARINPWVVLDPKTGSILPNDKYEHILEQNRPRFKL